MHFAFNGQEKKKGLLQCNLVPLHTHNSMMRTEQKLKLICGTLKYHTNSERPGTTLFNLRGNTETEFTSTNSRNIVHNAPAKHTQRAERDQLSITTQEQNVFCNECVHNPHSVSQPSVQQTQYSHCSNQKQGHCRNNSRATAATIAGPVQQPEAGPLP